MRETCLSKGMGSATKNAIADNQKVISVHDPAAPFAKTQHWQSLANEARVRAGSFTPRPAARSPGRLGGSPGGGQRAGLGGGPGGGGPLTPPKSCHFLINFLIAI